MQGAQLLGTLVLLAVSSSAPESWCDSARVVRVWPWLHSAADLAPGCCRLINILLHNRPVQQVQAFEARIT